MPISRLAALEDTVSFEDAATLGLAGRTALRTVRLAGPLLGRSALVLGAAGGVGHLVVQLAAHAGARVTAQLHDPGRASELIDVGADRVTTGDEVKPAAFDVVLDGSEAPRLSGPSTPSAPRARSCFTAPPTRSRPS